MTERGTMDAVMELGEGFKGEVIAPGDLGYDDARAVWNGSIDRRPALVVRPLGAADVIDAVNYARQRGLALAVRCGGHSVAGNGTVDGGVLVDLSRLKGVHVDPEARTARVNGGVLVGELDRETQLHGLATPSGRVTTTGVGGFTLGGGYGWLSPRFGLACDNLLSAEVVTADGRLVTASEDDNDDLLWGLRGGGGNFGVVTSYEFCLHRLGPTVLAGLLVHPIDEAKSLIRASRDYLESAPEELVTATGILQAPPAEFIPPPLGPPAVDLVTPMPYTAFQAMIDPFAPRGMLNYTRGLHLSGLPDQAVDAYVDLGTEIALVSSPTTQAIVFRHGGAVSRVAEDATAAGHRNAAYMAHPIAAWQDPAQTELHLDWVRRFSAAMAPFTTGGVYLNFEPAEGEERVRAGYGADKYARLVALKDKWDPDNLFRVNQNIRPSREPVSAPA